MIIVMGEERQQYGGPFEEMVLGFGRAPRRPFQQALPAGTFGPFRQGGRHEAFGLSVCSWRIGSGVLGLDFPFATHLPELSERKLAAWRALFLAIAGHVMSDPFDAPQLLDVDRDHFARLFIAADFDRLIAGGQAARPLGLCDAGHRAKGKPGLAGDLPEGLRAWRRASTCAL